ncbi:Uncharacterized protein dnm_055370 [Desulfonema magnum]|uniref:Uncharacterized protein n=1 Tax=Desulfonema magnum TaxID=45655 RepID=A0A975BPX7_9BACT|nr:Uncharacterized protein dnm_055370 [Desulfonema magnum]
MGIFLVALFCFNFSHRISVHFRHHNVQENKGQEDLLRLLSSVTKQKASFQFHISFIQYFADFLLRDFPKNKIPGDVGWVERSATHLVRWVALRSTHPTFFVSGMLFISSFLT